MKLDQIINDKTMKISKLLVLLAVTFIVNSHVGGQNLPLQSINTGGSTLHSGTYTLDVTMGQLAYTTLATNSKILTQGFQQANKFSPTTAVALLEMENLKSWPNPTKNTVNISCPLMMNEMISWRLSDCNGKIVKSGTSEKTDLHIDLTEIPTGLYIVSLKSKNTFGNVKITKID